MYIIKIKRMKKEICASNDVLRQMDEAVVNYNATHKKEISPDGRVQIARVVLPASDSKTRGTENKPHENPFLCFMRKASNNKAVIINLESGKAQIVDNASLIIKNKGMETFSLNGVRYKLKDNNGGFPRFAVMHKPSRSTRVNEIDF